MIDHHIHTVYSPDGAQTVEEACQAAVAAGLSGLVFTDHVDTGVSWKGGDFCISDPQAYARDIEAAGAAFPSLSIVRGMELGYTKEGRGQAEDYLARVQPRVCLGSVHLVGGIDPYEARYFDLHGREKGYRLYLEQLLEGLAWMHDKVQVVSHLDYVSKFAPYEDSEMQYEEFPGELDALLRMIVSYGLALEVNTSTLTKRGTPLPGPSILRRYHELGGRRITLGSDAHGSDRVGQGFSQMVRLLRELGFSQLVQFTSHGETALPLG